MKLPADLAENQIALIAPALRGGDLALPGEAGWRPAAGPRRTVDVTPWRNAYAAVRLGAESDEAAGSERAAWCCAFDPVRFVADMRDVRLAQWPVTGLDEATARGLADRVRALLDDDPDPRVRRLRLVAPAPARWYLVGAAGDALDFAVAPADVVVGHPLREHKPAGTDAALVQRLTTELQMLLHATGAPVNGVWPHGAGGVPDAGPIRLPRLCTDDPFWRGCWATAAPAAPVAPWAAAASLPGGAVLAPQSADVPAALERLAAAGHLSRIDIVTGSGEHSFTRGGLLRRLLRRGGA